MPEHARFIPGFLEPMLRDQFESDDVRRIMEGFEGRRAVTLRANTLLASRDEIARALDAAGITWETVAWYGDAFVLPEAKERDIWELPIYRDGRVYLQSLSSMIPALVLDARPGEDVCDMCAAPGGKTTQIVALSGGGAYVTACELHAPRAEKLEHNLRKLGARNVTVMRTDARRLDEFFSFDRILIDAPCSGSGILRADDSRIPRHFTSKLIEKSTKAQRALLAKGLSLLRPGGTLVYSTCSVLAQENEQVVTSALSRMPDGAEFEVRQIELARSEGVPVLRCPLEGALAICPTDRYEGFFVAKIVRVK